MKITKTNNLTGKQLDKYISDENTVNLPGWNTRKHNTMKRRVRRGINKMPIIAVMFATLGLIFIMIDNNTSANIQENTEDQLEILLEENPDVAQEITNSVHEDIVIAQKEENIVHKTDEIYTKEYREQRAFDIDKLAYAVAMQETKDCTLGYGKTHNNCFGIKHGNTVPCPGVPKMAMCKFNTPEESYEAFKKIWLKWYGELPTREMAIRWSGNDRADIWKYNVLYYYNK